MASKTSKKRKRKIMILFKNLNNNIKSWIFLNSKFCLIMNWIILMGNPYSVKLEEERTFISF